MSSKTEHSFGARLKGSEDLVTNLETYIEYVPPDASMSVESMKTLITSAKSSNDVEAEKLEAYTIAVDTRFNNFHSDDGIIKKLTMIRGAVQAQYGYHSKEAEDASAIIRKFRSKKKESSSSDANAVSQNQLSYGSLLQHLSDLISTLNTFNPAFNPANTEFTITNLEAKYTALNTLNTNVTLAFNYLQNARNSRNSIFDDLHQKCLQIKMAVKAQYGQTSVEFNLIKDLIV
jgi:hypothetical protein